MGKKYRVLVGLNYTPPGGPAEVRREPGETVEDLDEATASVFAEVGAIVLAGDMPFVMPEGVVLEHHAGGTGVEIQPRPRRKRSEE